VLVNHQVLELGLVGQLSLVHVRGSICVDDHPHVVTVLPDGLVRVLVELEELLVVSSDRLVDDLDGQEARLPSVALRELLNHLDAQLLVLARVLALE